MWSPSCRWRPPLYPEIKIKKTGSIFAPPISKINPNFYWANPINSKNPRNSTLFAFPKPICCTSPVALNLSLNLNLNASSHRRKVLQRTRWWAPSNDRKQVSIVSSTQGVTKKVCRYSCFQICQSQSSHRRKVLQRISEKIQAAQELARLNRLIDARCYKVAFKRALLRFLK